jgi:long-chain-fatty-acid---luciferin-component ligase
MTARPSAAGTTLSSGRVRAKDYDSLDHVLFEGLADYGPSYAAERFEWIAGAVRHHLDRSDPFRRLAETSRFDWDEFRGGQDLATLPLISSGSFKSELFSTPSGSGIRRCTSSGTMGTISVVPRDSRTIERYVGTILHGLREFIGHNDAQRAFVLGPPVDNAGDLWFSYSLGLAEVLNDADYFVCGDVFAPRRLFRALSDAPPEQETVVIAPPALLLAFVDWMDAEELPSLRLGEHDGWALTAGGWKRKDAEAINRVSFTERITERLGLVPERHRDLLNMVELNTLIFECEYHSKHVPPWLWVSAREPRDMSPLPSGEQGLLAYADPTALSYPSFILSDDFGVVDDGPCSCGRVGPSVRLDRRLNTVEERGCGLKMDRYSKGA